MGSSTTFGLPYPDDTEPFANGDLAIKALALAVESTLKTRETLYWQTGAGVMVGATAPAGARKVVYEGTVAGALTSGGIMNIGLSSLFTGGGIASVQATPGDTAGGIIACQVVPASSSLSNLAVRATGTTGAALASATVRINFRIVGWAP